MKKKHVFYLFLAIFAIFTASSCTNKSETLSIDRGENYFPLFKGKYWDYRVDSISYKLRNEQTHTVDSFHHSFFVRELVSDTLRDAAGRPSYRLERYTRPNRDSSWKLEDVWLITRTTATAERVEEDQRFLKLAFPVNKTTKWNCVQFIDPYTELNIWGERTVAAYSADKGWGVQSKYTSIDVPYTINGRTYDSTATVLFADSDANSSIGVGINRRYYQEVYARNIGLIYKRLEILDTQCNDPATCNRANLPWEGRAEVGFILLMKLDATN
ncbi:MAG: hypothetical protein RI894_1389 [Bacteroidota bacterium]|jgi:hypothetical protein